MILGLLLTYYGCIKTDVAAKAERKINEKLNAARGKIEPALEKATSIKWNEFMVYVHEGASDVVKAFTVMPIFWSLLVCVALVIFYAEEDKDGSIPMAVLVVVSYLISEYVAFIIMLYAPEMAARRFRSRLQGKVTWFAKAAADWIPHETLVGMTTLGGIEARALIYMLDESKTLFWVLSANEKFSDLASVAHCLIWVMTLICFGIAYLLYAVAKGEI